MSLATAGLMIIGLFPQIDEAAHHDGRRARMTAAELADKPLLSDEHADMSRKPGAWMVP